MPKKPDPQEKTVTAKPKYDWPEATEKRSLFVTLNPSELESESRKLAATVPQIANLEREAKSSASQWKSRIDLVQVEQNRLSNIVSEGKEERPVPTGPWLLLHHAGENSASRGHRGEPSNAAVIRWNVKTVPTEGGEEKQ